MGANPPRTVHSGADQHTPVGEESHLGSSFETRAGSRPISGTFPVNAGMRGVAYRIDIPARGMRDTFEADCSGKAPSHLRGAPGSAVDASGAYWSRIHAP